MVEPEIFVPTGFTPDGSGANDVFRVRGTEIQNYEMSVFDRNGELIYFSQDFYQGWDGTHQQTNQPMDAGAYVYRIKGFDELGEEVVLSGIINLIR